MSTASTPGPARWRSVVVTLSLTELISWGVLYYAFGVVLGPMERELGWSRTALGAGLTLALTVAALLSVPVARALERHGPRGVMALGSCLAALVVWGWSRVESLPGFYLLFALLGVAMALVLYEPAFVAVVGLLGRGRRTDLALLAVTVTAGLASTAFIPLTQGLVERWDWRGALGGLALLLAITTLPLHALLLAGLPARRAADAPVPVAAPLPRAQLALSAAAFALEVLAASGLVVHLVPLLLDRGFDVAFAATAGASIGLGQVVGRIGFTLLRARFPVSWWSAALFGTQTLVLAALALEPGRAGVLALIVLFALSTGIQTLARTAWAMDLFLLSAFPRVNAVLARWSLFGRATSPLLVAAAHDLLGGYRPVLVGLSLLCVLAGGSAALAARLARSAGPRA